MSGNLSDLQQVHILLRFQSPIFEHRTKQQIGKRTEACNRHGLAAEIFRTGDAAVNHELHRLTVVGAGEENEVRSFDRCLEKHQTGDRREIQLTGHLDRDQLNSLDIDHFGFEAVLLK